MGLPEPAELPSIGAGKPAMVSESENGISALFAINNETWHYGWRTTLHVGNLQRQKGSNTFPSHRKGGKDASMIGWPLSVWGPWKQKAPCNPPPIPGSIGTSVQSMSLQSLVHTKVRTTSPWGFTEYRGLWSFGSGLEIGTQSFLFSSSKAAQKTFREQKPHKATQISLCWPKLPGKGWFNFAQAKTPKNQYSCPFPQKTS